MNKKNGAMTTVKQIMFVNALSEAVLIKNLDNSMTANEIIEMLYEESIISAHEKCQKCVIYPYDPSQFHEFSGKRFFGTGYDEIDQFVICAADITEGKTNPSLGDIIGSKKALVYVILPDKREALEIDPRSVYEAWQTAYSFLDQLGTIITLSGAFIGIGRWIAKRYKKEPRMIVDIICGKEFWDTKELANELHVSPEQAKGLLRGFGFKWNNKKRRYDKTEETEGILQGFQEKDHKEQRKVSDEFTFM